MLELDDDFIKFNPHDMLQAVAKYFANISSPTQHAMLRAKARNTILGPTQDLDDYFTKQRVLRKEMARAHCARAISSL